MYQFILIFLIFYLLNSLFRLKRYVLLESLYIMNKQCFLYGQVPGLPSGGGEVEIEAILQDEKG